MKYAVISKDICASIEDTIRTEVINVTRGQRPAIVANGWRHDCAPTLPRLKRCEYRRLVRGDYKALKKDLLEAFGELTTDPKLVLRFLLEGWSAFRICSCVLKTLDSNDRTCPDCHRPFLSRVPQDFIQTFERPRSGPVFDNTKHFGRISRRMCRLATTMREKQLHADPSLQEEMGMNWDRQWCQMMLSFVKTMAKESLEYWNNFYTLGGINAYQRLDHLSQHPCIEQAQGGGLIQRLPPPAGDASVEKHGGACVNSGQGWLRISLPAPGQHWRDLTLFGCSHTVAPWQIVL
ncbi:hypothetical protein BDV98DRAFT_422357 [Pterulicium gracile]|uniref:Uncharacterized protein n=1 Tax=Pterulicium gracile TaxID=1884261 RepID=A0A5C3Q091_9AGAR|nr:hypothetical protein BDV98DRAFT_422357 [Pterula gracilis]